MKKISVKELCWWENMIELLKRSHKVKFTIDYEVYDNLNLQQYLNELKEDTELKITVLRVIDEIKISVELKE